MPYFGEAAAYSLAEVSSVIIAAAADEYWTAKARREALPDDAPDATFDLRTDERHAAYVAAIKIPATSLLNLGVKARLNRTCSRMGKPILSAG